MAMSVYQACPSGPEVCRHSNAASSVHNARGHGQGRRPTDAVGAKTAAGWSGAAQGHHGDLVCLFLWHAVASDRRAMRDPLQHALWVEPRKGPKRDIGLGAENPSSVVPKLAGWAYVAIEGGTADLQFVAEVCDVRFASGHSRLRQTDLIFGEFESAPALASASPGGDETSHRAFSDEIAFKLSERREYPEDQFPA
jgi:hypothetical protein